MRKTVAVAIQIVVATAFGAPAIAAESCPISETAIEKAGGYGNAVTAMVKAASTCERAYEMLRVCQLGSSGDNALSDIVASKCEPLFMGKASRATKAAYKTAQVRCNAIAEKNEGTMYQGLAAACRAKAARDLAHKAAGKR